MRVVRLKIFIGSTVDEISREFNSFFMDDLCPGNVIKTQLYKYGNVYQYEVLYAQLLKEG